MSETISVYSAVTEIGDLKANADVMQQVLDLVRKILNENFPGAHIELHAVSADAWPTARLEGCLLKLVPFTLHIKPFFALRGGRRLPATWLTAEHEGTEYSAVQLINGGSGGLRGEEAIALGTRTETTVRRLAETFVEHLIPALFSKIPQE